ncbi:hypothetical protein ITI46_34210 [Streptomyces oryzae]|uniref:Uncharacterized protein n=1 Tax=Streptomyces oryzae TaxID=1434886 RepID=A0ABS3XML7_9ACTN|nr:hypothetical protein [Streptomyces oryzae]
MSAASEELAWAVGEQGVPAQGTGGSPLALRWDGTEWSHTDVGHLGLNGSLRAVSGTSPDTAWAVGEDRDGPDRLLRWDGGTWRQVRYPGDDDPATVLTWVAVGGDGRAWVTGQHEGQPKLLRFDGDKWRWTPPIPGATSPNAPWRVRVSPSGGVHTVGWDLARWDEGTAPAPHGSWTVLPPLTGIRLGVSDLLPTAPDDMWAVGAAFGVGGPPGKPPSVVLAHFDGTEWAHVAGDTLPFKIGSLNAIAPGGAGADGAAGGPGLIGGWDFWDDSSAHYLRWSGTEWAGERGAADGVDAYVRDVAHIPGTGAGTDSGTSTGTSTATQGGAWSVGHTRNVPAAEVRFRIERYG